MPTTRTKARPCVLVVDDDPDFRIALAEALDDENFRVVQAIHGRDALTRIEAERPALILVDLLMPTMSGLELLQTLRKNPRHEGIPVIVVTAANDAMLSIKLDVPVLYKGDFDAVLGLIRDYLSPNNAQAS